MERGEGRLMYGSDNAWQCTLCGKRDKSVRTRPVACRDGCDQGIAMVVCEKCARASYEEAGADE